MDSFSDYKEYELVELSTEQTEDIAQRLEAFDEANLGHCPTANVSIGIKLGENIIGGGAGSMGLAHTFHVSAIFVDEEFRRMGYGRKIVEELERRAKDLGAEMVRLDTFDFRGQNFFAWLGYEKVGHYKDEKGGFEGSFFIKWLNR